MIRQKVVTCACEQNRLSEKVKLSFSAQKFDSQFWASLPSPHASVKGTLSKEVCVTREYMIRHVVYHVLPRDMYLLSVYESVGRVALDVI